MGLARMAAQPRWLVLLALMAGGLGLMVLGANAAHAEGEFEDFWGEEPYHTWPRGENEVVCFGENVELEDPTGGPPLRVGQIQWGCIELEHTSPTIQVIAATGRFLTEWNASALEVEASYEVSRMEEGDPDCNSTDAAGSGSTWSGGLTSISASICDEGGTLENGGPGFDPDGLANNPGCSTAPSLMEQYYHSGSLSWGDSYYSGLAGSSDDPYGGRTTSTTTYAPYGGRTSYSPYAR